MPTTSKPLIYLCFLRSYNYTPTMPSSNSSEKSPPMWPGFHADQVRARGKRPSVRLELGEIRAILAARKEHSPMPRSPIRIRRDGLVRG